jgi:hypothetical protein
VERSANPTDARDAGRPSSSKIRRSPSDNSGRSHSARRRSHALHSSLN